jgi:hypothetical protein
MSECLGPDGSVQGDNCCPCIPYSIGHKTGAVSEQYLVWLIPGNISQVRSKAPGVFKGF